MIVYITTNIINGKKYIGKDEANNPNYLGSGKIFKEAIKKYGKDSFIKEILAEANNREDLCKLEKYYIDYYNANKSEMFYNITEGGNGGKTSDQLLKKVKIYQFSINGILLRSWISAKEAAIELGINRTNIVSSCNLGKSYKRFLWSYLDKIDNIPFNRKFSKPVVQLGMNGEFIREWPCLIDIQKELGFNKSNVQKCCKGKYKIAYNYKWIYK